MGISESTIPLKDFVKIADEERQHRSREVANQSKTKGDVLYCQEVLAGHPELDKEFSEWDWSWVVQRSNQHKWGLPETNVLFMGSEGATTPCHFDEQHNFLNQVRGEKLVVLFPPDHYTRMYPFPVTHPCDRCAMVDVGDPDIEKFPKFADAHGYVATLGPGDVLYIPYGWWHYCKTVSHLSASITFWSKASPPGGGVPAVFGPSELSRARRNLEKIIVSDVGASNLSSEVERLMELIRRKDVQDPRLQTLKRMVGMLQIPEEQQLEFLEETFTGRFGFDPSAYI